MNKIINDPVRMIPDMLDGYLGMYGDRYRRIPGTFGGMIKKEVLHSVRVLIAGGGGNEPWCIGYVGEGMADAMVSGNVYAAPPALSILDACRELDGGSGILLLGTNHMGDVLNFELVKELASLEGIATETVFVNDDIGSDLKERENRRGVAGIVLAVQMAGGAASLYTDLERCARVTQEAVNCISTLGVTTSPGYMPANGKAMCQMPEGVIEYGMGFNGEPGFLQTDMTTAHSIAETVLDTLLNDLNVKEEQVVVLLNGYGFTSQLEMLIVAGDVQKILAQRGVDVYDMQMANAFCPQGTGGFSITLMKLTPELKKIYDVGADSPLFKRRGKMY